MEKSIRILLFALFLLASFNVQAQEEIFLSVSKVQIGLPAGMTVCMKFIPTDINGSLFGSIPYHKEKIFHVCQI